MLLTGISDLETFLPFKLPVVQEKGLKAVELGIQLYLRHRKCVQPPPSLFYYGMPSLAPRIPCSYFPTSSV